MSDIEILLEKMANELKAIKAEMRQEFNKINNTLETQILNNFFEKNGFLNPEPINRGLSFDKKYIVTAADGSRYFVKIKKNYEKISILKDFNMLQQLYASKVPMPRPIEAGICQLGAYIVTSALDDGYEELGKVLQSVENKTKEELGERVGDILLKIHTAPLRASYKQNWAEYFKRWCEILLKDYETSNINFAGQEFYIDILKNSTGYITNSSYSFLHYDFHVGNILIKDKDIQIIDFGGYDNSDGDPYKDFAQLFSFGRYYPYFVKGVVKKYFKDKEGELESFYKSLKLYIAYDQIKMIVSKDQEFLRDSRISQAKKILKYYDNMKNDVPSWFRI